MTLHGSVIHFIILGKISRNDYAIAKFVKLSDMIYRCLFDRKDRHANKLVYQDRSSRKSNEKDYKYLVTVIWDNYQKTIYDNVGGKENGLEIKRLENNVLFST